MTNSNSYKSVPDKWVDFLVNQPETGMGYWIVSVILNDGKRYDRVVINGGLITQIYGEEKVPFNPDDIADIRVTHDKWTFNE